MIYESVSSRWVCATPVNKNTTYSTITISEIETGTDTTGKLVSPSVLSSTLARREETLPNKTYEPAEFSGLGRKYLQKTLLMSVERTKTSSRKRCSKTGMATR